MTPQEVASFVISRWRIEHTPEAIMMALLMSRAPLSKAQILAIIKRYCDCSTENATYKTRK